MILVLYRPRVAVELGKAFVSKAQREVFQALVGRRTQQAVTSAELDFAFSPSHSVVVTVNAMLQMDAAARNLSSWSALHQGGVSVLAFLGCLAPIEVVRGAARLHWIPPAEPCIRGGQPRPEQSDPAPSPSPPATAWWWLSTPCGMWMHAAACNLFSW